ncbi:30S ribosomal protein S4 [Candidatus Woesearchaeota archaeon]|jgi:small subunit ribosomal protein S4|nr:30S ribosomal protein S4 [Candidatus Woesearchaeota archaeon]MBT6044529.1 30S ribosomal protein S4 [Candidatus Woesearchaeota archaeon]
MGTVRRLRSKYDGPSHPWEADRLAEEKNLTKEYGLKNKKEIWKINSKLRGLKTQAKNLIADRSEQARKEEKLLLEKLASWGVLKEGATLDDVLEVNVRQLLARRLQSVTLTKGLARSSRQARQMISHGHITINKKKTNIPSYLVKISEESKMEYSQNSKFKDSEHPELNIQRKEDLKKVDVKEVPVKEKPKEAPTKEKVEAPEQPKETKVEQPTQEVKQ